MLCVCVCVCFLCGYVTFKPVARLCCSIGWFESCVVRNSLRGRKDEVLINDMNNVPLSLDTNMI